MPSRWLDGAESLGMERALAVYDTVFCHLLQQDAAADDEYLDEEEEQETERSAEKSSSESEKDHD